MAFTDQEKLFTAKMALEKKILQVDTWANFKDLVQNITSNQLKNLIKAAIATKKTEAQGLAIDSTTKAADLQDLSDELDAL